MGSSEIEVRMAELEARLAAYEDREAIAALKARYARLVDARYTRKGPRPQQELEPIADELAGLFHADAVWDGGPGLGVCRGREAIRARFLAPTLRSSRHYFLAPALELDGDTARGRWELLSPCTTADGRPMWLAGVEHDEYVREDGVWLHRSMRLEVAFFREWGAAGGRDG